MMAYLVAFGHKSISGVKYGRIFFEPCGFPCKIGLQKNDNDILKYQKNDDRRVYMEAL